MTRDERLSWEQEQEQGGLNQSSVDSSNAAGWPEPQRLPADTAAHDQAIRQAMQQALHNHDEPRRTDLSGPQLQSQDGIVIGGQAEPIQEPVHEPVREQVQGRRQRTPEQQEAIRIAFEQPDLINPGRLKERGWTREQIILLGEADDVVPNPVKRGGVVRLFRRERVEAIEAQHGIHPAPQQERHEQPSEQRQVLSRTFEQVTVGSLILSGRVHTSYQPGVAGAPELRASGSSAWVSGGGSRQGKLLGRLTHLVVDLG